MEIIQLSPETVDQIAAGEVVERPSHLIKELVENSLDAGAHNITVQYSMGGRFVKVIDDGKGLYRDDMALALSRHATSKIKKTDDLWNLSTFGFRGEALASISAVSKLTMITKRKEEPEAYSLISQFGKISEAEVTGGSYGTTIIIEDLFANVPARLKFLKSDSSESQQIKATLKALALAHPAVTFKIEENGKLLQFYKACESRLKRAEQVLEISPLYEGFGLRENVKAHVIFTDPHQVQKTSRHIWIFAQGRWIQDRSLQAAVTEAYRSLLMHGEFPSACVWVELPPTDIDVNIHPTKSQVKFRDPSLAFRAVHAAVRDELEKAPWLREDEKALEPKVVLSSPSQGAFYKTPPASTPIELKENLSFGGSSFDRTQYNKKSFTLAAAHQASEARQDFWKAQGEVIEKEKFTLNPSTAQSSVEVDESFSGAKALGPWSKLQVLGQAHLTYIVCQSQEGLVFVDQHAAHERVAFERLMQAWKGGRIDVQEFLFPLAVDLSPDRVEALEAHRDLFLRLGISIEALGPSTMGVKSAPLILKDGVLTEALEKMSQELLDQGGSHRIEKIIGDVCATMACHSVVRAGQSLSLEQMQNLLKEMDEFPLSSFCPHGRPVSVKYPLYQLEKDFGRIV